MADKAETLRNLMVQGWRTMPILLITQLLLWMLAGTIQGNLQSTAMEEFGKEDGALWMVSAFFIIAIVMPFLIKAFRNIVFRWVVFAISLVWAIMNIASLFDPGRPGYLMIILLTHDIIAIWTAIIAFRWARLQH
jgi:hypothetical protein